ncbi:MAG: eukaryotic-like serine/threonine-protein kinase, partial [Micromonosporaceae bacterium]|nr:eukaryotic-like serine/threonine-protein kinase [Micromonosporaceae bacterium]
EKSNPPAAATADTTDRAGATVVVKPAAASSSRGSADGPQASSDTPAESSDLTTRLWQPAGPAAHGSGPGEAADSGPGEAADSGPGEAADSGSDEAAELRRGAAAKFSAGEATGPALGEATGLALGEVTGPALGAAEARLGATTEAWPGAVGSRETGSPGGGGSVSPNDDADEPVAGYESESGSAPAAWRARAGAAIGTVPRPWLLAAAVTVLVALIVALVALPDGGASKRNARAPRGPSPATGATSGAPAAAVVPVPAPSTAPSASSSPTEGSSGVPLPAGWQMYTDSTGFSLAAPVGWNVQREGTILYFREPGGGRVLGIDQTDRPNMNPVADWTNQRNHRVPAGDFPGYQEIGIRSVPYFVACADWEFTYDRGGGRTHAINRGFVTSDHQAYGIWWSTPDSSWQDNLRFFNLITGSFKPKP